MSVVTNILVTFSVGENYDDEHVAPPIIGINQWLEAEGYGALNDLVPHAGGRKCMECGVYGGAFNYLNTPAFMDAMRAQAWNDPKNVRVLVQGQNEDHFSVYTVGAVMLID